MTGFFLANGFQGPNWHKGKAAELTRRLPSLNHFSLRNFLPKNSVTTNATATEAATTAKVRIPSREKPRS